MLLEQRRGVDDVPAARSHRQGQPLEHLLKKFGRQFRSTAVAEVEPASKSDPAPASEFGNSNSAQNAHGNLSSAAARTEENKAASDRQNAVQEVESDDVTLSQVCSSEQLIEFAVRMRAQAQGIAPEDVDRAAVCQDYGVDIASSESAEEAQPADGAGERAREHKLSVVRDHYETRGTRTTAQYPCTIPEQVAFWEALGMEISDPQQAELLLRRVSIARLSRYYCYWQHDAEDAMSTFRPGTRFERLEGLYRGEQRLKALLADLLRDVEEMIRAQFARIYIAQEGEYDSFLRGAGMQRPPGRWMRRAEQYLLADINRSMLPEIVACRERAGRRVGTAYGPEVYRDLSFWHAIQACSFGSLVRVIEATAQSGMLRELAQQMKVPAQELTSYLWSLVELRNLIAHGGQLWHYQFQNTPELSTRLLRRAYNAGQEFSDNSVYAVLLILDEVAQKAAIVQDVLKEVIDPYLETQPLLRVGLVTPHAPGAVTRPQVCTAAAG